MRREEHCKQISLACVVSAHSVSATLGLSPLTECVVSQSTLLRLQVALKGNCPKQALGCVHFLGLSCSGSGSWVLHKGTDSFGPVFCTLPRSEELRRPGTWRAHCPRCTVCLITPVPSCSVSWVHSKSTVLGVPCVSSGGLISGCNHPGRCQPSRIPEDFVNNWEPAPSLVEDAIFGAEVASSLLALDVACRQMGQSTAG